MSAVSIMSFTAMGQPSINDSGWPFLYRSVEASAAVRAIAGFWWTQAATLGSSDWMVSKHRSRYARGVSLSFRKSAILS